MNLEWLLLVWVTFFFNSLFNSSSTFSLRANKLLAIASNRWYYEAVFLYVLTASDFSNRGFSMISIFFVLSLVCFLGCMFKLLTMLAIQYLNTEASASWYLLYLMFMALNALIHAKTPQLQSSSWNGIIFGETSVHWFSSKHIPVCWEFCFSKYMAAWNTSKYTECFKSKWSISFNFG